MEKGVFGIKLSAYAVLALVFAYLGQTTLLALLLGFVIVTEKNEWLTRQVMQVFFLVIGLTIVVGCVNFVGDLIVAMFSAIPEFIGFISVSGVVRTVFDAIAGIFEIAALVFEILALIKVIKGKEAGIPLFSALANKALGVVKAAPQVQYPQYPQYPQQ